MSVSDSTSCRIAQAELRAIWKVLAVLTVALDRIGTYHYVHGEAAARSARSTFMTMCSTSRSASSGGCGTGTVRSDDGGAGRRAGSTHYLLGDMQGSTRLLATSGGTIAASYQYDAFGNLQHGLATPETSYLYTGQQFDVATGLYALRARYYNPADGRFLSRDPYPVDLAHPVELNRYVYVANDPVNAIDPLGLMAMVSYAKANHNSKEQTKHRAAYKAGTAPSCGADRMALYQQSVLSAIADQITVSLITAILDHVAETGFYARGGQKYRSLRRYIVFGLGTILHLQK